MSDDAVIEFFAPPVLSLLWLGMCLIWMRSVDEKRPWHKPFMIYGYMAMTAMFYVMGFHHEIDHAFNSPGIFRLFMVLAPAAVVVSGIAWHKARAHTSPP